MEKNQHTLPNGCGYQIVRRLGSGGEGTVYLVCHLRTEQLRAAKVLTNVHRDRLHELNMMKHLDHPSLPKIMDVLTQGDEVWLIMEYIRGRRLDILIKKGLSERQIREVALQLSEVLLYLHSRTPPILHLDIKPSNLLIRPDGRLFLIDFGASVYKEGTLKEKDGYGTRGFAAPEQFQKGASLDVRTDFYGFGATLYYCRYGKAPDFAPGHPESGRDTYRGPLQHIVRKCLSFDPQKRYQNSRKLEREVRRAVNRTSLYRWILVPAVFLVPACLFLFLFQNSARSEHPGAAQRREQREELLSSKRESESETECRKEAWIQEETKLERESVAKPLTESMRETDTEAERELGTETNTETERELEMGTEPDTETETGRELEPDTETETEDPDRKRQDYVRYLKQARGAGFSEAVACFEKAAELFPADESWYLQLLETVTADGLFDQEEEEAVRALFYTEVPEEEATALELLEKDRKAYGEVAYRMGLAYWYDYGETGGKAAASWWFGEALGTLKQTGEEPWERTAQILSEIGSYYGMLERTSDGEEREKKECAYFRDLKELWGLFTEQQEETGIRLETAEELLFLEVMDAYELRRNGETAEELLRILSEIENFLESDSLEEQERKRGELEDQCAAAREAVDRAFQDQMEEETS